MVQIQLQEKQKQTNGTISNCKSNQHPNRLLTECQNIFICQTSGQKVDNQWSTKNLATKQQMTPFTNGARICREHFLCFSLEYHYFIFHLSHKYLYCLIILVDLSLHLTELLFCTSLVTNNVKHCLSLNIDVFSCLFLILYFCMDSLSQSVSPRTEY